MKGHESILGFAITLISCTSAWPFSLGIENIADVQLRLFGVSAEHVKRIGLVTNQTGRDQQGNRTVDILCQKGIRVTHILAPEHGFDGKVLAGKLVADSIDKKTGIPILSVYGRGGDYSIKGKRFDPNVMNQIDILCYDLQDVGMRHYTYISTLLLALEAAAQHNKPIIVFDRPNLLGPHMEGPLVDPDPKYKSFISMVSIPLRHGMTVAELALYFNNHVLEQPAQLHVVKMKQYRRAIKPTSFTFLSPNLRSMQSCYGYSFLGLLGEISPFDVGVGTPYAFQTIVLPDSLKISAHTWSKFRTLLQKYNIQTMHHSLLKRGQRYTGLKLHFTDIYKITSFELLLDILKFFKKEGVALTFSHLFDKATGTSLVKQSCDDARSCALLAEHVNKGLEKFIKQARGSFLYEPIPKIVLIR